MGKSWVVKTFMRALYWNAVFVAVLFVASFVQCLGRAYAAEAALTLILSPKRWSRLLLLAIIFALTDFLLRCAMLDEFRIALAGMANLFFAGSTAERYTGMTMSDGLVALADFARPWHSADT